MGRLTIPFYDLTSLNGKYRKKLISLARRVIDSGTYMIAKETRVFEDRFAEYCKAKYCIGVGNGLDALTLTLRAYKGLGVFNEGDEVIVPANTYIATILSIPASGLRPVLVEPDIRTYNLDATKIEEKISK